MTHTNDQGTKMTTPSRGLRLTLGRLVGGALCAATFLGCDVENPGRIDDEALNTQEAMQPLVTGMAGDFATNYDDIGYFMGIASNDITHTGAFEAEQFMQRGEVEPRHVNELWGESHRARWVAESGIQRMQEVMGDGFSSSALAAEAYLWAGYSNRVLGENMCVAVIDGGAPQDHTVHFERAESHFTEALEIAMAADAQDLVDAANAGLAQVRLGLGDWSGAAAAAGEVPDDFEFLAQYSAADSREWNWLHNQSHRRDYFSVINSVGERTVDPRTPWTDMERAATDGSTPMYRQDKYLSLGAPIQIAAGDEMRLIEAEAALRVDDDVGTAMGLINGVRADAGVPNRSASTVAEAMQHLRTERNIVLWMEGRRLFELRRFDDPFLDGRDSCIPVSENEANTNPNIG